MVAACSMPHNGALRLDTAIRRNGSRWRTRASSKRLFRPKAKLLRDGATFYLAVEGMDDMVEVRQER